MGCLRVMIPCRRGVFLGFNSRAYLIEEMNERSFLWRASPNEVKKKPNSKTSVFRVHNHCSVIDEFLKKQEPSLSLHAVRQHMNIPAPITKHFLVQDPKGPCNLSVEGQQYMRSDERTSR